MLFNAAVMKPKRPDSQTEDRLDFVDRLAFAFSISRSHVLFPLQFFLFNCLSGSVFPSASLSALGL